MSKESTPSVDNTDPTINLVLKVTEINAVLAGLQELQFKIADPLIKSIIAQAQGQLSTELPEASAEEAA